MFCTANMRKCSSWRPVSGGSESRRQTDTDVWDGLKRGLGSYRARTFDQWRFHGLRSVCVAGSGRFSRLERLKFPMKSIG